MAEYEIRVQVFKVRGARYDRVYAEQVRHTTKRNPDRNAIPISPGDEAGTALLDMRDALGAAIDELESPR